MSIFFKNNQEQRQYVKNKLSKLYPNFKTGGDYFVDFLSGHLEQNSLIVDAGCGEGGDIMSKYQGRVSSIIGLDIDSESLEKNQNVDQKIVANLEQISLEDNTIDIVVAIFVLEHLKNPLEVFKEIRRVLKKDGVLIFLTPNLFNPIMFFSKISPYFIHKILRKYILKNPEKAYKTFYKINTKSKLVSLLKQANFTTMQIKRAGNPEYLGFCKPLVGVAIFWEKIIASRFLNFLKMYLIGKAIK
ncbi:MAG TPA: class I SAM-dependent methyltransferase [bacterium]|nr:class I SAM-dependent methyltransferase [bacterium]